MHKYTRTIYISLTYNFSGNAPLLYHRVCVNKRSLSLAYWIFLCKWMFIIRCCWSQWKCLLLLLFAFGDIMTRDGQVKMKMKWKRWMCMTFSAYIILPKERKSSIDGMFTHANVLTDFRLRWIYFYEHIIFNFIFIKVDDVFNYNFSMCAVTVQYSLLLVFINVIIYQLLNLFILGFLLQS